MHKRNGENIDYYKFVDYYNMGCTDTRLIMKNFMPYQQTMASSCTLCSLMVTMNYYGEDIVNTYDEVALVKQAIAWGHPGIAITDHDCVQAFPHVFDTVTKYSK